MKRLAVWCVLFSACGGGQATVGDAGASDATTLESRDASTSAGDASVSVDNDATALCVKTINDYRATLGVAALTRWGGGETCAASEAKTDSMTGTAHNAFGACGESAQDECPGWNGPPSAMITQCLAQMWAEGPGSDYIQHGHYINMSSTSYTQVSCGFYTLANGSVWAAQNFR